MKYRLLGNTGLYVSELCLGTMTFGSDGFWKVMGGLDQPAVNELVKIGFEAGINFFDRGSKPKPQKFWNTLKYNSLS